MIVGKCIQCKDTKQQGIIYRIRQGLVTVMLFDSTRVYWKVKTHEYNPHTDTYIVTK